MDQKNIEKMSLKEVMEYTKNLPIYEGGLSILLERIIDEIEELKNKGAIDDKR